MAVTGARFPHLFSQRKYLAVARVPSRKCWGRYSSIVDRMTTAPREWPAVGRTLRLTLRSTTTTHLAVLHLAASESFIDAARQGFRASARQFLPQFSEFPRLLGHHFKLPFRVGRPNCR